MDETNTKTDIEVEEGAVSNDVSTDEKVAEKLYTEDELNARVDEVSNKRVARKADKIRRELNKEYEDLLSVLRSGTGKADASVDEITQTFAEFYRSKGIETKKPHEYSKKDAEILAKADAEEIIGMGYEEVVEETKRLSRKGIDEMTDREKHTFRILAEHAKDVERESEIKNIGIDSSYDKNEFSAFAKKFNEKVPLSEIYETYKAAKGATNNTEKIKPTGSMKSGGNTNSGVKEFYSFEEAMRFTKSDFDKNPELFDAVQRSMRKW